MGERLEYYRKRQQAIDFPSNSISIIVDGMQQSHNQLPWFANLKGVTAGDSLAQHFQGVLAHGRFLNLYRTFQNIKGTCNLQIHTFLLGLEAALAAATVKGQYPDTVYYQIDGGSENIAKTVLAMCELIVAKGIVRKIILARLPVGHTHEDIDSKFAVIWRHIRLAHLITMKHYESAVRKALGGNPNLPVDVIDLFAVPDYISYLHGHIDNKFGRYCKQEWTQLQFTFQKVELCSDFPLGVKTTYRPYVAENAVRICERRR
jgi:hypothetical protein